MPSAMPNAQTQENQSSDSVGDAVRAARGIAESSTNIYRAAVGQAKCILGQVEDYVGENPWRALGMGVGAGLLLGLILRRR